MLPMIPQLVALLSARWNDAESALFNARIKSSLFMLEDKYGKTGLPLGVQNRFVILNTKPPKPLPVQPETVMD